MPQSVRGVSPIHPARRIEATTRAPTQTLGALEPATRREVPPPFVQILREALHRLRERVTEVRAEAEPLNRVLGFRSLEGEADELTRDLSRLEEDEQRWAKELRSDVREGGATARAGLDATAEADLALLLQLEQRHQERVTQRQRLDAAAGRTQERARAVARLVDDEASAQRTPLRLPYAWVLPVLVTAGALLALSWRLWSALPLLTPGSLLQGGAVLAAAAWFFLHPLHRRAAVLSRLADLRRRREREQVAEADAASELRHALKVFEEVDAACRREEEAALAVFHRRPGAQRYLRASGAVVVTQFETPPEVFDRVPAR